MTGAACGAGNAYPSGAPDFTCLLISCYRIVFWILIVPFV